jgi:hypothetical protein
MQCFTLPLYNCEDNTGVSSGKLLPFCIRDPLHVENTNHRLLGTPSSVSKECSQAYINCQNLLNLFSQHPHRGLRVSLQVSNPG